MRASLPPAGVASLSPVPLTASLLASLLVIGCGADGSRGTGGFADLGVAPDLARGGVTLDPGVVSKSVKTQGEAETHVMAANNGFVAIAYIGLLANGGSTNGYLFSKDDGVTWEPPQTLDSPNRQVSSDPVLAADEQGNFYMTWIGFRRTAMGGATDMHVYAATAPAGTTTFGAPVEVSEPANAQVAYDKPWITIANDGAALITYAQTGPSTAIFAARSGVDGNRVIDASAWTNAVISNENGFRNLVFPCHPQAGSRMYAVYHAGGGIGLRWSEDNGASWNTANKTAVAAMGEQPAFEDPTCAAEGDEVWVSYGMSQDRFDGVTSAKLDRIRLAHSVDGGKTIADRWDAMDPDAGNFSIHPYMVREGTGGALDLVYYAGNSEGDPNGSFRLARSTDNGQSFAPSKVVRSPVEYLGSRSSPKWLGDYVGLWWLRGNVYIAYVDNHGTVPHVAFYRTAAPPQ